MASAPPTAYSVWIPCDERLTGLVSEVSTRFEAPAFPAHVTLLGNAPRSSEPLEARALVQALANELRPWEQRVLPGVAYQSTWNQNVLLYAEASGPRPP